MAGSPMFVAPPGLLPQTSDRKMTPLKQQSRSMLELFCSCPSQTLFHVIDRKTGKAVSTRFYGDALVVFHHINAYEADGHVVFDLITYKNSNLYDMFYIQNMTQETNSFIEANKGFSPPICQRFVLPLNVHKVQIHSKNTKHLL